MAFHDVTIHPRGMTGLQGFGDAKFLFDRIHFLGQDFIDDETVFLHMAHPFFAAAAGGAAIDGHLRGFGQGSGGIVPDADLRTSRLDQQGLQKNERDFVHSGFLVKILLADVTQSSR